MLVQLRRIEDRARSSLFLVPMLFVVAAIGLGEVMIAADDRIENLPERLTATVDSSRSVLTVVAGATLAFAGIAFSVSLLLISLASSQYSPRVVHGLFRDPFNKRVMGVVIGTFTYCLVVMRAVRLPVDERSQPVAPSLATALSVGLGIVSVLSIVAFISHSAHLMDVSKILHRVTGDALDQVRRCWPDPAGAAREPALPPPPGAGFIVAFDKPGWIQQIDHDRLLGGLEPGSCLLLDTATGRYATPGAGLGTIWPSPDDEARAVASVRSAIVVGESRTMQQDVTYGIRQLADVALKALSPGINDPTTAQDALFHLGSVVGELLGRTPPPRSRHGDDGRVLLLAQEVTLDEVVALAFDEVRIASMGQPTVQIYLLELIHLLVDSLRGPIHAEARALLQRQADLVVEVAELTQVPEADRERVRSAHGARFAKLPGQGAA